VSLGVTAPVVGGAPAPAADRRSAARWGFPHVPPLDGLRGVAVVAVLLYHGGYLEGGYLGVDLFFVLSGYLITSLLLAESAAAGTIGLRGFWVRRIRRLIPALLLVLVAIAAYAWLLASPVDLAAIRDDGLATLFYAANWHTILRGASYWDISLAPSPLQHTWSLAIEEQFYLVWPLVVLAVVRRGRETAPRRLLRLCTALAVVSTGLFVVLPVLGASATRAYEGTDTRATALLLGAGWAAYRMGAVTQAGRRWAAAPSRAANVIGVSAALALGLAWVALNGQGFLLYRGGLPLVSLLAAVVVAAVADGGSTVLTRALSWAPVRGLGLISYGLYLWHWPLYMVLTPKRTGLDGVALFGLRVAASVLVAVLSYRLVERPIRKGAIRGPRAVKVLPLSMATAALLLVVATLGAVPPGAQLRGSAVASVHVAGAPTVMFVGDSVALSLVRPVARDPEAFDVNPIDGTAIGCSVVAEGHRSRSLGDAAVPQPVRCTERMVDAVRRAHPDLVVMLVGHRPGYELRIDGRWVRACDPAFDAAFTAANRRFLDGLAAAGAPVVAVAVPYPDPDAPFMPAGMDDMVDCINQALARAVDQVAGTRLLDLNELVCPRRTCIAEIDGSPIRTDGLHFDQGPGGRRVVHWLLRRALALAPVAAA